MSCHKVKSLNEVNSCLEITTLVNTMVDPSATNEMESSVQPLRNSPGAWRASSLLLQETGHVVTHWKHVSFCLDVDIGCLRLNRLPMSNQTSIRNEL